MQYHIGLYFDHYLETGLYHIAKCVADQKISTKFLDWNIRPHITLACYNDVNESKFVEIMKRFAFKHFVFPISIDSVGMFTDTKTIYASPVITRQIYDFHSELHDYLHEFDRTGWEWYCPDQWVPHCTLALLKDEEEEAFYRASELVLRQFRKMEGMCTLIGFGKFTCPAQELISELSLRSR